MRKTMAAIAALVLLTGCTTTRYEPTSTPSGTRDRKNVMPGYSVVNNTPYLLDVVQDGNVVSRGIRPGQVLPLRPLWLRRNSTVTVLGYDEATGYAGTDSHIFSSAVSEVWTVNSLIAPGGRW